VHFAHSRQILHRDIKPDNVMLGPFGEVYLVDWGIAVSMVEDENTQLPLAKDAKQPAGTPGYMAPEMAAGDADLLGPRTDVYLLGAILHELLVGQVRHLGKDLYSIMFSAYRSEPFEYGEDIPEELAQLCNRAMHVDPARRFEDAEAFRQALAAFRRHRSSRQIVRDLEETLGRIEALAQQEVLAVEEVTAAHGLFGTCRFGYQQALRVWAENAEARDGVRRASTAMLTIEVASGNLVEVEALLAEVEVTDAGLLAEIEGLRSRKERESKRLEELEQKEHAMDLSLARRQRGIMTLILGAIWSFGSFGVGQVLRAGKLEMNYENLVIFSVTVAVVISFVVVFMWRRISVNQINRRLMGFIGVIVVTGLLARLLSWVLGIDPVAGIAMEVLAYAMITLTMGILVERLAIVAGLLYAGAAFGAAAMPAYCWEWFGLGNTIAILILGYRWSRAEDEGC
jgi:serine/threonine-protein kinase